MSSQAGISACRAVNSASGGDDSQFFLPGERLLPLQVPPVVELPLIPVGPLLGDVVGSVRRAGREVDEERLVRHQRLLLTHPAHSPIGQILGQVISLLGGRRRLNRSRAVVQRGIPLVVLPADEAVEGSKPPPPDGHASNGPMGEDCHTGTSWHLPNWAVEYPFNLSVIASGAFVFGRTELLPGADVAVSVMLPIPTE